MLCSLHLLALGQPHTEWVSLRVVGDELDSPVAAAQ